MNPAMELQGSLGFLFYVERRQPIMFKDALASCSDVERGVCVLSVFLSVAVLAMDAVLFWAGLTHHLRF